MTALISSPEKSTEGTQPQTALHTEIVVEEPNWEGIARIEDVIKLAATHAFQAAWNKILTGTPDAVREAGSGGRRNSQALNNPLSLTVEVSILLTSDQRIQTLNKQFRGKDKPTNVLSFPSGELEEFSLSERGPLISDSLFLGDVAMAYETTEKEARQKAAPLVNHVSHLIIHAILHLLGWDHVHPDEASEMEAFEVQILKSLDIASPYEEFE